MTSDADLIARSWQEPEAFRGLFDRHFARVYRYLAGRAGPLAAEDLAAECFLRAFDRRTDYNLTRPDARPWLLGIATNLLRERRRSEERRLGAIARSGSGGPSSFDAQDDIEGRLDARAVVPALARALGELRPAERDVLLLVAFGELSPSEVAVALGVPAGTARARLARARTAVRRSLGVEASKAVGSARLEATDLGELGGRA